MGNIEETWFIVVNPHAGNGRTAAEWGRIEQLLKVKGISYEYRMTGAKAHATQMVFKAAREGYRKFIAAGGDGTIHEVAGGIMLFLDASVSTGNARAPRLSDFTLAVIPVGSGNDWIRGHGIGRDIGSVVDLIGSGSYALQDIVKVSSGAGNTYMVNIGGVGFDARVCERVNRRKDMGKRGRLIYIWSLIHSFFRYRPSPMEVCVDGRRIYSGNCFSVAIGIGKYSGGGMRQTPDAVTDDGMADVTVIPPLPFMKIALEIRRLFDGSFSRVRELVTDRGRVITVRPVGGPAELVEVDGETVGNIPVKFEVLPEQIWVLHRHM